MTPDDLATLLGAAASRPGIRLLACPDEHEIAAYVDGTLESAPAEAMDQHLADCDACIALVGLLSRERNADVLEETGELAATSARRLPTTPPQSAPWWVAAAAALVISVSVLATLGQLQRTRPDSQQRLDMRATRNGTQGMPTLQVLAPKAGTAVDPKRMSFRWTAVPGSQYYEVRILSDAGDVLADERVSGTQWQPHSVLALRPGVDYYVHVDAHLTDDRSVGSEHVTFRVVP
jgi:hypothetical protein